MRILALNGSPRKEGTVALLLRHVMEGFQGDNEVEWIDVGDLNMQNCAACMKCRSEYSCVLPEDDAHVVGRKIANADALIIGTPVHWGNMCAPLKLLLDRNVHVFMHESTKGIPTPLQKGKRAVLATACTTPWPFNFLLPESRGALRAVKEVLHCGGYKLVGSVVKPGTKKSTQLKQKQIRRAIKLGAKLIKG